VKRAVLNSFKAAQAKAQMTRNKVLAALERAGDMAETQADPTAMVGAWREIGKMCGFYAVETKKVEVTVNGEIGYKKLAALSDEDLMKLARGEVLEGEFAEVVASGADVLLTNNELDELDGLDA
jgi:hypothetical protein